MRRPALFLALALAGAPLCAWGSDGLLEREEYTFCQKPSLPLSDNVRALCPLASEVPNCAALIDACEADRKEQEEKAAKARNVTIPAWMKALGKWFAELSMSEALLQALRALGITAIALLLWWAIRRFILLAPWKSDEGDTTLAVQVSRQEVREATPADALWAEAETALQAQQYETATRLYLHAAIERGVEAGRITRTQASTYGECVRQVPRQDRADLSQLCREVERHDFGGEALDQTSATRARAWSVNAMRAFAICLALALTGCKQTDAFSKYVRGDKRAADIRALWPMLHDSGVHVESLPTTLYDPHLSDSVSPQSAIWIDVEETELDDDARHQLGEWVKAGGLLVLVDSGSNHSFLGVQESPLQTLRLHADLLADAQRSLADDSALSARSASCQQARAMFSGKEELAIDGIFSSDTALMSCGTDTDAPLAHGAGIVRRLPGVSAFSNLGLSRPQNRAFAERYFPLLLALPGLPAVDLDEDGTPEVDAPPARTLYVAQADSGTRPATSPVHALYLAGLGPFFWHGVVATLVLLWAGSSRLGRARSTVTTNRERYATHVETLGMHYAYNMPRKHKLELMAQWLRTRTKTRNAP